MGIYDLLSYIIRPLTPDKISTAGEITISGGPLSLLIPNLPDDISLQCIARTPRPYHSSLSTVSKSWRSTIRSPEFFNTRSLLRSTQQSLFLSIRVNTSLYWYLVNQNHKLCINLKFQSPLPPTQPLPIGAAFAVLSPKFYVMGGSINEIPSNHVWIFDFRFGTWEIGPNMRVGRQFAVAGAVNGKIYVIGGCAGDNSVKSMNWCEVFDPVIGVWEAISSPIGEVIDRRMHWCCVLDGRIYGKADGGGVVYNAVTGEWATSLLKGFELGWSGVNAVVDGVMYCYDYSGKIRGYDAESDEWDDLKGVDGSLFKFLRRATMASLNGKLCVVWEREAITDEVEIMCAEIEVWKDDVEGFCGSVLWSDVIHWVPSDSLLVQSISVDL